MFNDDITEFVSLDVEELHLVGEAANQFHPLVAKSAQQKGSTDMGKKVLKAGEADTMLATAISLMKTAAADADRSGEVAKADAIRREVAVIKLQLSERAYVERGSVGQFGPGVRKLFEGSTSPAGPLGDDPKVSGF